MEGTTGRQRLSKSTLENLTIPLPPLPEQHAIAQALKAVQEAKQARQRELELERERKAALMEYLFRHGTRGEVRKQSEIGEMPESWNVVRLGDIAAVAYGLTVNQNRRGSQQQVPYLTVANVSRGALRLNDIKQIGVLHGDAQKYRLCAGDVLLVEGNGNPKLLGSAAVWHDELPFALHQNHLIRARPDQTVVVSEWLMSYLNSDRGRAQLLGRGKTSNGLHSINSRIVADLLVPVPTMREQQQVTQVLTSCDQKVITLEREIAYVDELFHAILEEIMTGRLSALPLAEQLNSQQGEAHEHQRTWRRRPFHC
jgi:type I restriction enzyme S subunit